jgi:type II secretion system protein H
VRVPDEIGDQSGVCSPGPVVPRANGFSLAELLVVLGLIGLVAVVIIPYALTYWQTSKLRAGARELVTILNQARQMAVANNRYTCVKRVESQVQIFQTEAGSVTPTSPCTASSPWEGPWTGPGTDASGNFGLADGVEVSAATADVVFTYLGTASTTGTFTVRNPTNGATLSVSVAASGRATVL